MPFLEGLREEGDCTTSAFGSFLDLETSFQQIELEYRLNIKEGLYFNLLTVHLIGQT